jgi:hypothetical protein
MYENKINLVFIGIFNFLGFKLTSMHVLFHSYLPLPNFFGEVMHFGFLLKNKTCASLSLFYDD